MEIKVNGKNVPLKFTYNSFRYMEDLDISEIDKIQTNPFKIIKINEILLLGALNHNPKNRYSMDVVVDILENAMNEGTLVQMSETLMGLLEESSFFQNLQVEEAEVKPKPKKKA